MVFQLINLLKHTQLNVAITQRTLVGLFLFERDNSFVKRKMNPLTEKKRIKFKTKGSAEAGAYGALASIWLQEINDTRMGRWEGVGGNTKNRKELRIQGGRK